MNKAISIFFVAFFLWAALSCSDVGETFNEAPYMDSWQWTTAGVVKNLEFTQDSFQLDKYVYDADASEFVLSEGERGSYSLEETGSYFEGSVSVSEEYDDGTATTWVSANETKLTRVEIVDEDKLYLYFRDDASSDWGRFLPDNSPMNDGYFSRAE